MIIKRNELCLSFSLFSLSVFPEFLNLSKGKEGLFYRGQITGKEEEEEITKKGRCLCIFLFTLIYFFYSTS